MAAVLLAVLIGHISHITEIFSEQLLCRAEKVCNLFSNNFHQAHFYFFFIPRCCSMIHLTFAEDTFFSFSHLPNLFSFEVIACVTAPCNDRRLADFTVYGFLLIVWLVMTMCM